MPLNTSGTYLPRIQTPAFWPADEAEYGAILSRCERARPEVIGHSAGGRELWGLLYDDQPGAPLLGVVGGMHGHEAQGPAACLNLINILETGVDLRGQRSSAIQEANFAIVPLLNPDARARMPNSFVGLSVKDILNYDSGLLSEGQRKEEAGDMDPEEALILGGLYNDAGVDLIRYPGLDEGAPPELRAVMGFISRCRPAACLELHAHAAPPQFYCPLAPLPAAVQTRQIEVTRAVIAAGNQAGYDFAANTGEVAGLTTALYHGVGGAVPLLFESPQGVLDAGPRWDHARIVEVNLFVIGELARLLGA